MNTYHIPLKITAALFSLSLLTYAMLTLPFALEEKELWLLSMAFAGIGGSLVGLPVVLLCLYRICLPGNTTSAAHFRRSVRTSAMAAAAAGAGIVTIVFIGLIGGAGYILLLPLAGALSPLPVTLLLRGWLTAQFHRINP